MSSEQLLDPAGWISEKELAERLGLHLATVKGWRQRGKGGPDHYLIGPRAVRYRVEDVEDWLREHQGK